MSPRRKKMKYIVFKPLNGRPGREFPYLIQLLAKDVRKGNVFSPKVDVTIRVLSKNEIEVVIGAKKAVYVKEAEYIA